MGIKKGTKLTSSKDTKLLKQLGKRIKEVREKAKLTVYDVTGEDLEIRSRQHWQKIEAGQKNINFTTLAKVAKTLEISMDKLLRGINF